MNITDHAEDIAKKFRGNWMHFESFAWHERPEDAENWGHWNIDSRDSCLLEESNAAVIRKALEPFFSGDDCRDESHGHWGVGYVGVITCRVYKKGTEEFTPAFLKIVEFMLDLQSYPVLDESDYSNRQHEAALANIKHDSFSLPTDEWPEDYSEQLFGWFSENDPTAVETDERGACPGKDKIIEAATALGWKVERVGNYG